MFVGLIDTRRPDREPEPPEREPPPRRRFEMPWHAVGVVAVLVALFVTAKLVGGILAYGLLLAAVTIGCLAIDRAFGYWSGLTEHRQ